MEIVNCRSALLSNYEVLKFLQGLSTQDKKRKPKHRQNTLHLANIVFDTTNYLEKTPCKYQTEEITKSFLTAVIDFKLTKTEKLQLLNLRPTTAVEMQLIIEDSEERLTEDQIEELISLVQQFLPDKNSCNLPNGS